MKSIEPFDVIVVDACAADVSVGKAHKRVSVESIIVLERVAVDESFRCWPEEMRFMSPSFPNNACGLVDLMPSTTAKSLSAIKL
jgi:hypothetical protein